MVRGKAGMPNFWFRDLRHHFISMCVMSGIDFMTIAGWVGHKDGGVLIGRVYGHLIPCCMPRLRFVFGRLHPANEDG